MSNRNYNATGKPAFQAPGTSADIKNEFAAVSAGFSGVEAELDQKAALAEVVAARAGNLDLNTRIALIKATVDALGQTSLNGSLPAQAGKAGYVIRTDGTNASWYDLFLARLALTSITAYTYNTDGTIASITYATGEKEIYTYSSGNLTTIQYTGTDGSTVQHTETITYSGGNISASAWS